MNDEPLLMMCFTQMDVWDLVTFPEHICGGSKTSCSALWDTAAHIREAYGMVNHPDTSGIVAAGTVCGHAWVCTVCM